MNQKEIEKKIRKNIELIFDSLTRNREHIKLLTLTNNSDAVYKLKDEDWVKITGFKIEARKGFEVAINRDLVSLVFD